jgi:hypothetical protein
MKSEKGRNRTGALYRRWKRRKYPIDDPSASGRGAIYLKCAVNGKVIEWSLDIERVDEVFFAPHRLQEVAVHSVEFMSSGHG